MAIFVDGAWGLGMLRCGVNPTTSLAGVVGTDLLLEKYKLAKLEGVPSVHEFENKNMKGNSIM